MPSNADRNVVANLLFTVFSPQDSFWPVSHNGKSAILFHANLLSAYEYLLRANRKQSSALYTPNEEIISGENDTVVIAPEKTDGLRILFNIMRCFAPVDDASGDPIGRA